VRWRSAVLRIRRPSWNTRQAITWVAVMCVVVPLLAEGAARLIYVFEYDDIDFLRYPSHVPVAPDAIAVRLEARNRNSPAPLPPGDHPYIVDQEIQYTLPINESGFRGKDIESPREADKRIVSLGGSSTFSGECPMGESYPEVWGQLLDEQLGEGAVEVLNMGIIGCTTAEIGPLIRDRLVGRDVDLVTVCVAYNNLQGLGVLDLRPGIAPWHRRVLWGRSLLYTVMFNGLRARQSRARPWETLADRYRSDLERMIPVARRGDMQLLFVLQPLADPGRIQLDAIRARAQQVDDLDVIIAEFRRNADRHAELCEVMAEVAERNGIPWVDPRAAVRDHPVSEDHFHMFLHLTPVGSRVMAEEIHRQVQEKYGGLEGVLGYGM